MSSVRQSVYTPQQYVQLERASQIRHQFYGGEIFAMTGASRAHNLIAGKIFRRLSEQFDGRPCEAYQSDMRVKVAASGLYTYPDVVATCEHPQFEDEVLDTLLNPQLIVEVLSDSTENYDRGKKFEHYRRLESLRHYILVAQNRCHLEMFTRMPDDQWLLWETSDLSETVSIQSIHCELPISDIYARVQFAEA